MTRMGGRQCYFRCGLKECPPKETWMARRSQPVKSKGKSIPDSRKLIQKSLEVRMSSVGSRGGDQANVAGVN